MFQKWAFFHEIMPADNATCHVGAPPFIFFVIIIDFAETFTGKIIIVYGDSTKFCAVPLQNNKTKKKNLMMRNFAPCFSLYLSLCVKKEIIKGHIKGSITETYKGNLKEN